MILTNKSQTVVFCGIIPKDYGLEVEFSLVYPEAPIKLELYKVPIKPDSKPMGIYRLAHRVDTPSVWLNRPLKYYDLEQQVND